jgi:hypothetical protein
MLDLIRYIGPLTFWALVAPRGAQNETQAVPRTPKCTKTLPFWGPLGTQAALVHQGGAFVHQGLGVQMHGELLQARKN